MLINPFSNIRVPDFCRICFAPKSAQVMTLVKGIPAFIYGNQAVHCTAERNSQKIGFCILCF